jgi:hypothetical protein
VTASSHSMSERYGMERGTQEAERMPENDQANPGVGQDDATPEQRTTMDVVATVELRERRADGERSGNPRTGTDKPRGWQDALRTCAAIAAVIVAAFALYLNYRAMVGTQRAWILLANNDQLTDGRHNVLTTEGATLYVRNFGHSPASNVTFTPRMMFDGERPKQWFITADPPDATRPLERVIAPGATRRVHVRWAGGSAIRARDIHQIIVVVEYGDSFSSYRHQFCVKPDEGTSDELVECEWSERENK